MPTIRESEQTVSRTCVPLEPGTQVKVCHDGIELLCHSVAFEVDITRPFTDGPDYLLRSNAGREFYAIYLASNQIRFGSLDERWEIHYNLSDIMMTVDGSPLTLARQPSSSQL